MTDKNEYVEVPFDGQAEEKAILLLDAAERSEDHDASAVQTRSGAFYVPKALADAAGVEGKDVAKQADKVRASRDEGEGLPRTIKGGAGPTGEVDTNAGEDAEMGTVQNQAEEGVAPDNNIETIGQEQEQSRSRKTAKKSAAKKADSDKDKE